MNKLRLMLILCVVCAATCGSKAANPTTRPVEWIQPSRSNNAKPIWGLRDCISVGLSPTPGPRGLIRIYTPYLHQSAGRIEQFIAVEPIVHGMRDLSELQNSSVDQQQGKVMWSADQIDPAHPSVRSTAPARGILQQTSDGETLSFFIDVEKFDNGAHPIIKLTLNSAHPHEISLQTFAAADSAAMECCVLTATMGNFSRLRHLNLNDRTLDAADIFHDSVLDPNAFYPWREFTNLIHQSDDAIFSATGELDLVLDENVPLGWRYEGVVARQYWRTKTCSGLTGRVNGRTTFWASHAKIPGGVAFENIELKAPFIDGQIFYFGVNQEK